METEIDATESGGGSRALNGGSSKAPSEPESMDFEDGSEDGGKGKARKPRITYDRDFLLTCSQQGIKSGDFLLAKLGDQLGCLKGAKPAIYVPPKRKEDLGRKEPDDNISLRPQSRGFTGGYLPSQQQGFNKEKDVPNNDLQRMLEDNFMDRNGPIYRYPPPNKRFDFNDRNRPDPRDRDMRGDRDRDRDMRGERDNRDRDRDMRDNRDRGDPRINSRLDSRNPRGDFRDRGDMRDYRNQRDPRDRDQDIRGRGGDRDWDPRDLRRDRAEHGYRDRNFRDDRDMEKDKRGDRDRQTRKPPAERPEPFNNNRYLDQSDGLRAWEESEPMHMNKWNYEQMKNGRPTIYPVDIPRVPRQKALREIFRRELEAEPEWFSGGPSSRHETMELRGFDNDDRNRDPEKEAKGATSKKEEQQAKQDEKDSNEREGNSGLNFDKILAMEDLSGLENGLLDEGNEPSGTSKFSQIFQRNSGGSVATDDGRGQRQDDSQAASSSANVETEEKKEIVEELGNALRNILFNPKTAASERAPEPPKFVPPPKKTDKKEPGVNTLKALLNQLIEPSSSDTESEREREKERENSSDGIIFDMFKPPTAAQEARTEELRKMPLHELLQISTEYQPISIRNRIAHGGRQPGPIRPPHGGFRPQGLRPSQGPIRPPNYPQNGNGQFRHPGEPVQVMPHVPPYPLHSMPAFENLVRPPYQPSAYAHLIPPTTMSVQSIFQMMPVEIQFLIQHVDPDEAFWSQADAPAIVNAMTTGQFSFWGLLEDLSSMQSNRKPFLASLVQLILTGLVHVPTYQILGPPLPPQNQRSAAVQNQIIQRVLNGPNDEGENDSNRRSNTPVPNNMTFCPTAVMRKMTGDSPKPTNPAHRKSPQTVVPVVPTGTGATGAEFSMIVQQLTGQQMPTPRPIAPTPLQPAQYAPMISTSGQIMLPQHQQHGGPRMMHPFPPQPQQGMNMQQRPDMPHNSHS